MSIQFGQGPMSVVQDVRYAARVLRNSPGFAATAVITIGLGIGATTAIFSVCDALLWKPVPLPQLDTLVTIVERGQSGPDDWNTITPADFTDIARESANLGSVAAWASGLANLVGAGGEPERVSQALTTANFFDVVGVQPIRGRAFQPGEDEPGRDRVVILSDRLWKRRFGGDSAVVGQNIRFDDQNFTVIGIMPPSYDFPIATEVWTPFALQPMRRNSRTQHLLQA